VLKLCSPQTAHQIFWEHNNCPHVYEYDPTDDGPEVGLIRGVRASHAKLDLFNELYTQHKRIEWRVYQKLGLVQ
jgi:hypothetical protein